MTPPATHMTSFGRRARMHLRPPRSVRGRHPLRAPRAREAQGCRLLLVAAAPPPEIETTAGGW
jgi:hypothetical protein